MANFALEWDKVGEHLYETGTDRGVIYPYDSTNKQYSDGAAWNGLTGVTDNPSGADETKLWADNIKYVSMRAAEEYGGTITAYTYPDEFAECDGSAFVANSDNIVSIGQQKRKSFGLSYRTLVGNDTELNDYGYKIHLVYGATVSPSSKDYKTVNDSPDAVEFSWEFTTTPESVGTGDYKPTSHIVIDASKIEENTAAATALEELEAYLYGSPVSYTLLTANDAPADWTTATNKYYSKSGNDYTAVVGATTEYAKNTYYVKNAATAAQLPSPEWVIDKFTLSNG